MNTTIDDLGDDFGGDPWLQVLAGRARPHDADTRQAARARALLERQAEEALAAPADPAARTRLLNRLEAQAAALAAPAAGPAAPGDDLVAAVRRFVDAWFTPRRAGPVLALMVLALALPPLLHTPDDDEVIKTTAPAAPPVASGLVLMAPSARPLEDALALREALRPLGMAVELVELGTATRVQASVPAEAQAAVQGLLKQRGVEWVPGPQLSVEFQRRD